MSLLASYKHGQPAFMNALSLPVPSSAASDVQDAGRNLRRKTWDISPTFHCSIVGTCLTTTELRQVLAKLDDTDLKRASDHVLHSRGVRAAGQRDIAGKLLNKALDRRHDVMIKRFARLSNPDDIRQLWLECLERGEIAGAYWAVVSHPATDQPLLKEVFGEVHMLSHLVGSSNRLDIARLRTLQAELDTQAAKIRRQEERLSLAATERDSLLQQIEALEASLIQAQARVDATEEPRSRPDDASETLQAETARADNERKRAMDAEAQVRETEKRLQLAERRNSEMERSIAFLEEMLAREASPEKEALSAEEQGIPVLYVGGRRNLFDRLRSLASRQGVALLTHDGGIEDNNSLLPGLVSQAKAAFFPVDCISHAAAGMVKRLCQEHEKPFVPLRSASLSSFLASVADTSLLPERLTAV